MDEKSFRKMIEQSSDRRQRELEVAHERARRRESLLTRAISTNRVRVDTTTVDEKDVSVVNPRAHFERDLQRLLRTQREPTEEELDQLFE